MKNLKVNKILWLFIAALSLVIGAAGIFVPDIYNKFISADLYPEVFARDIMITFSALLLIFLTIRQGSKDFKKLIVILGIVGYLFYASGLKVFQHLNNGIYVVYLTTFGLSLWAIVLLIISVNKSFFKHIKLPAPVRSISVAVALIQPLIAYPILLRTRLDLISSNSSNAIIPSRVILDLTIVMPAFVIAAVLLIRRKGEGIFFVPAIFITSFIVFLGFALDELVKPIFDLKINSGLFVWYISLAYIFFITAYVHIHKFRFSKQ